MCGDMYVWGHVCVGTCMCQKVTQQHTLSTTVASPGGPFHVEWAGRQLVSIELQSPGI